MTTARKLDLKHAVFPILPLRPQDDDPPRVYCDPSEQGSAFFLTRLGLFVTAKHVVNKWSVDSHVILAFHFGQKVYKKCRVLELARHPDLDLAIGMAEQPGEGGWPHPFTISGSRIGTGAAVFLHGFANTTVSLAATPTKGLIWTTF